MATTISGWDIFKIVLGTGAFTAIVNFGLNYFRDSGRNMCVAKTYAVQLATHLECYSLSCAAMIQEYTMYLSSDSHAGEYHKGVPEFSEYPEGMDLTLLDNDLLDQLLMFPNEVSRCQKTIDFWFDIDDEQVPGVRISEAGRVGSMAIKLAISLRSHYDLQRFNKDRVRWDYVKLLEDSIHKEEDD